MAFTYIQVTLALESQFKRNVTNVVKDDIDLEDEILPFAAANEFGDLTWYSSQRRVVHRIDNRVPVTTPGNGFNDFVGFQSTLTAVSAVVRATENSLENKKDTLGKCKEAKLIVGSKMGLANGLKNNEFAFTGYPVVGFQNRMQTSGLCYKSPPAELLVACPWDPRFKGLFFYETTAIFRVSTIKPFISDVKKLRDMEPDRLCGVDLYNGFLIRFLKGSTAYLGQAQDSVVIDFNYYRAENGSRARLNEDVWEKVEQMAFFKHGAVPHWAKNRNLAFLGAGAKYPNLGKFLHVMRKNDPDGLFSSDWSNKILLQGGSMGAKADGCALEGMCICDEDRHCAPSEGYLCLAGKVYSEARVCRHQE